MTRIAKKATFSLGNMSYSERAQWSNEEWLALLNGTSQGSDDAIAELRRSLDRRLRAAFRDSAEVVDANVEDWVQESLVRIMNNLDSFRGDSRFMTWATRIAINVAYSDLRRARYSDISLDGVRVPRKIFSAREVERKEHDPELRSLRRSIVKALNRHLRRELTGAQRKVFYAVQIKQVPLSEVARRLGISRGTLYKRMHDARKRIKAALEAEGYSYEECSRLFEGT